MRPLKTIVIVLWVLGWQAATAWADEVMLKNGDRLSGDILKMGEGILVLKTTYAGEVKIDWKDIQEITSTSLSSASVMCCPSNGLGRAYP